MKRIKDLTEIEVLNLTQEDIGLMVRFAKADEGIAIVEHPQKTELMEIKKPTKKVFYCDGINSNLVFEDLVELNAVIELIEKSKVGIKDYNYNKTGYDTQYLTDGPKAPFSGEWDEVKTTKLYTKKEYDDVVEAIVYNKNVEDNYKKAMEEFDKVELQAHIVQTEIYDRVSEVRSKYQKLNHYCFLMRSEYMPLANNDEDVAIGFLDKVYALKKDDRQYVLHNYKATDSQQDD